jgi:hypothetical protein
MKTKLAMHKITNVRLSPEQETKIKSAVEGSSILDKSKFIRLAVDWLLVSNIGEVLAALHS